MARYVLELFCNPEFGNRLKTLHAANGCVQPGVVTCGGSHVTALVTSTASKMARVDIPTWVLSITLVFVIIANDSGFCRAEVGDQHGQLCKWGRVLPLLVRRHPRLRPHRAGGHLRPGEMCRDLS